MAQSVSLSVQYAVCCSWQFGCLSTSKWMGNSANPCRALTPQGPKPSSVSVIITDSIYRTHMGEPCNRVTKENYVGSYFPWGANGLQNTGWMHLEDFQKITMENLSHLSHGASCVTSFRPQEAKAGRLLHGQFGLPHSETLSLETKLAKIKTKPKTATEISVDLLNSDSSETCGPLLILKNLY